MSDDNKNHHSAFTRIRYTDRGLHWVNLAIFFTSALLVPTASRATAWRRARRRAAPHVGSMLAPAGTPSSGTWRPIHICSGPTSTTSSSPRVPPAPRSRPEGDLDASRGGSASGWEHRHPHRPSTTTPRMSSGRCATTMRGWLTHRSRPGVRGDARPVRRLSRLSEGQIAALGEPTANAATAAARRRAVPRRRRALRLRRDPRGQGRGRSRTTAAPSSASSPSTGPAGFSARSACSPARRPSSRPWSRAGRGARRPGGAAPRAVRSTTPRSATSSCGPSSSAARS